MIVSREKLHTAKRIVIKVGSSTITHSNGKRNFSRIESLAMELSDLSNCGKEIILVSSGAIAVGVDRLGLKEKPKTIPGKQAAAAVGQGILMHTYEKIFADYGQIVAQILLTKADAENRKRYTNCRNTFLRLLESKVIPIVNENDAVAVDEIKIGDNDNLSAIVASIVDADLLILLSDIDGLYTANPQIDKSAQLISQVEEITEAIEALAGGAGSSLGTGGMATKIQAGKVAVHSGIPMVIASGEEKNAITRIVNGELIGTLFISKENKLQFRKRWLAFGANISGKIFVDDGCAKAISQNNSSLLPAGIIAVEGNFENAHTVAIYQISGREIARGLVNFSSKEIQQIKGLKSNQVEDILGQKLYDEVVHRDNLVILV